MHHIRQKVTAVSNGKQHLVPCSSGCMFRSVRDIRLRLKFICHGMRLSKVTMLRTTSYGEASPGTARNIQMKLSFVDDKHRIWLLFCDQSHYASRACLKSELRVIASWPWGSVFSTEKQTNKQT